MTYGRMVYLVIAQVRNKFQDLFFLSEDRLWVHQ